MTKNYLILFALIIFLLPSCGSENGTKNTSLLPKASGRAGEIIVVMDSGQWNGLLGAKIKQTFRQELPGLPRTENMFKINQVDPQKFNSVLKTVKNILFVVTIDKATPGALEVQKYFTPTALETIQENEKFFISTADDEFAKDQKIMYLFGKNEKALIKNIADNESRVQNFFNQAEKTRLRKGLFKAKEGKGLTDMLIKDHDTYMQIPFGYKLVLNQPGFVWFRQINDESDKNVFITYRKYNSEKEFSEESIIKMRDSLARNQLFEDPDDPETYILTETKVPFIPVVSREINFKNKFAKETRGIWKTNNLSMGGPFLGYTMVDEELGRLYYIEGFVYSPGKSQREFMREMEVILSTFRVKAEIPKK